MNTGLDPIAHLNAVIEAFGRGGVNAAAIDLGVSHSMIAHYRAGRKKPTPQMQAKILALPVVNRVSAPIPEPQPVPLTEPDTETDQEASNVIPISHDLDALRDQVMDAETRQRFSIEDDAPKVSKKSRPPMPAAEDDLFLQLIWGPVHHQIASFQAPERGQVIVQASQSQHGLAAAGAIQRTLDRAGVMDKLEDGHWSIDLGIVLSYVLALRMQLKAVPAPTGKAA